MALYEKANKGRTHVPYRNSMMTSVLRLITIDLFIEFCLFEWVFSNHLLMRVYFLVIIIAIDFFNTISAVSEIVWGVTARQ